MAVEFIRNSARILLPFAYLFDKIPIKKVEKFSGQNFVREIEFHSLNFIYSIYVILSNTSTVWNKRTGQESLHKDINAPGFQYLIF